MSDVRDRAYNCIANESFRLDQLGMRMRIMDAIAQAIEQARRDALHEAQTAINAHLAKTGYKGLVDCVFRALSTTPGEKGQG